MNIASIITIKTAPQHTNRYIVDFRFDGRRYDAVCSVNRDSGQILFDINRRGNTTSLVNGQGVVSQAGTVDVSRTTTRNGVALFQAAGASIAKITF